jgi:hypothetical protein
MGLFKSALRTIGSGDSGGKRRGRRYSINFWKKPKTPLLELELLFSNANTMTRYLNLHFVFDEVSLKTPYLQKLIVDSSKVMDFLCDYHIDYRSKKPSGLAEWVFQVAYGLSDL